MIHLGVEGLVVSGAVIFGVIIGWQLRKFVTNFLRRS